MNNLKICKKCKVNSIGVFNGYWPYLEENYIVCKECGGFLESTDIDSDDFWIIWNISHNNDFIEAMIDLKNKDIIEYELKMSQFRNQLNQQKTIKNKQQQLNVPHCPYCNSTDIKKISGAERIASTTMFGIFSKKIGKSFKCNNCGGTF